MKITFTSDTGEEITTTTIDNIPDSAPWPRLLNYYMRHLNNSGYSISEEHIDTINEAITKKQTDDIINFLMQ